MQRLEISQRLKNILIECGVKTLEDASKYPKRFWMTRPGCSNVSIGELKALLNFKGLDFAHRRTAYHEPKTDFGEGEIANLPNKWITEAKHGDVYFIQMGDLPYVKIGFCKADGIERRLYGMQTGSPYELKVIGLIKGCGQAHEKKLHSQFEAERVRGEWFKLTERVLEVISSTEKSSTTIE